jgi:hypothetical protein
MNPYQSPSQQPNPHPASLPEPAVRESWLVRSSLLMVLVLETPTCGMDPSGMALASRDLQFFLASKAVCLAIILAPLCRYLWMNGWRGVIAAKGIFAAIVLIVGVRLALELYWVIGYFVHI